MLRQKGDLLYLSEMYWTQLHRFSMMNTNSENEYPTNVNVRDEEEIRDLESW